MTRRNEAQHLSETPLTRDELFGWFHRMYERYEERQAKAAQAQDGEQSCDDSTASE